MSTTVTYKGSTLTTVNNETRTLTTQGKYLEDNITLVDVTSGGSGSGVVWQDQYGYVHLSDEGDMPLQTKTVTPTTSAQTITADAGYYALQEVDVSAAPTGTAGTPTATKGTVSNHSVSVTPSVTNTTGYITGSTKTGTAVTVSASELVSGTKSISANGAGIDVTNYASVDVSVSGGGSTLITKTITENGTYNAASDNADGYSQVTVNVSGGGGGASKKQINFIDYDGSIVESYTKTEWQSVSALPSNPSHTGLTAQGWNWTKAQIDAQLTAMPDDDVWVGQVYITDDGKTRIYIHLEEGRLHPYLGICPNGTVVVDWGDNSATSTLTGTSLTTAQYADHIYASEGDYKITLTASSGSFAFYGASTTSHILKKDTTTTENIHQVYTNAVQKIEIGSNASIADYAFNRCYSLASVTIPSGVTSIGTTAFDGCYSLTSVTIPSGVTSISGYAFQSCTSLTSVTIPSGVTSIGTTAFGSCYSLTSVTIPSGVTSIGTYAFSSCYSLTSVTIPSGVTSIDTAAFYYCYSLASVTIPSGVTSIGGSAFRGCYSLASVTIPSGVTSIGGSAFRDCYSLASITIPDSVTSIGTYAFQSCYSLASITIPSDVTTISNYTFYGCYSLASVTIPSGVTSIGTYAFYGCFGMAEYHILPTTPPTLANTNAFTNIQSDCVIYVPATSLTNYQTANNWSTYSSYMQGE